MASVDGARSLLAASDETHEYACDPCKTEDIEREARHYCMECQEYLCENCKQSHQRFKLSKNHEVLSGSRFPKHASTAQQPSFTLYCSCNQNREVEVYCEEHGDVICISCKVLSHRKCKLFSLRDKARNYSSERLQSVLDKTKSLKIKMDQLHKEKKASLNKLEDLKAECKKEIRLFRVELNSYLYKLEESILKDMDDLIKELIAPIDEQISSLTAAIERLGLDLKTLEHARKFGRTEPMFASEMKVSKSLEEYETLLGDLHKYGTKPALSFERNKKLTDILKNVDTLGSLQGNMEVAIYPEIVVFPHLKIQSSGQVDIAISQDKSKQWTSGCCFMPSGYLVLCDYENDRIILLDQAFVLIDKLELKTGSPYDVAIIDDNNIITTVPMRKQLMFIQIFPKMKAGKPKVIQLDGQCYGVCVTGGKIYTSLAENSDGEVRILDLEGNLKKRIVVNHDGKIPFRNPNYLAVSKTGKEIFVADWRADTVTCMSGDGKIIYLCKDANIKGSRGVYVDAGNNVYVCASDTNNIGIITADGRLWKSLASSKEGILSPCSIAFRSSDRALVVGCSGGTKLCCFKLE